MPDFQDMLKSKEAAALAKDEEKLNKLRDAPGTQRLFQLLNQSAGGDLESAANRAAKGDTETLMNAIKQLMGNPEGQKLLEQMKQSIK